MNIFKWAVGALRNLFAKKVPAAIKKTFDKAKFSREQNEAATKLAKKLSHRIGPGIPNNQWHIRKKRIADMKRFKAGRWISGKITPPMAAHYHTPEAAKRAMDRVRRFGRGVNYETSKLPPRWMTANAQMAADQLYPKAN